jgi:hypothetical protein
LHLLKNGPTLPAHGPAQMPVWGSEFQAREPSDQAKVEARIKSLVEYLKSKQKK